MSEPTVVLNGALVESLSPALLTVVRHLCEGECRGFGDLVEWCESRHDCAIAVICPACSTQFLIDDDDLVVLSRWTESNGIAFGCGLARAS